MPQQFLFFLIRVRTIRIIQQQSNLARESSCFGTRYRLGHPSEAAIGAPRGWQEAAPIVNALPRIVYQCVVFTPRHGVLGVIGFS